MSKPLIIIPIGDPAGIGPEIVAKALAEPRVTEAAGCIAVGDKKIMELAGLNGREKLAGYDVESIITYEGK